MDASVGVSITIGRPMSMDEAYNGTSFGAMRTLGIVDDDSAGVIVSELSSHSIAEAGGSATFTVVLTSQPRANVVIGVISNATHVAGVSPQELTFSDENWAMAQPVTITAVDNDVAAMDASVGVSITIGRPM